MLSRLGSILDPHVKKIKLNSGQKNRLYLIEKQLNDGRLGLREGMDELRRNLEGNKYLNDGDYREIEKRLGFNGIKEKKELPKENIEEEKNKTVDNKRW
jgi:hypothetical protein